MNTKTYIRFSLLLLAFLVTIVGTAYAAETWVSDPKTGTRIGWSSVDWVITTGSWTGPAANGKAPSPRFVTRRGTQLLRDGVPYRITGANMWYAAWLGADAEYGDRARLVRELERSADWRVVALVEGRVAVRDLTDEWKYGLFGMSDEARRRESLNIVLSMPPGTDPDSLRAAASGFAGGAALRPQSHPR